MRTFKTITAKPKSEHAKMIRGVATVFQGERFEVGLFAPDLNQLKRAFDQMARDAKGEPLATFNAKEAQRVLLVHSGDVAEVKEVTP